MKIGILSFTDKGKQLEERIKTILEQTYKAEVMTPKNDKKSWVNEIFSQVEGIIFIGAMGIAVRYIANNIKSKDVDPAIIVIDELANYVIPILSGHIGGANALAEQLANILGARAVITTATDINNVLAIDNYAMEKGYAIIDINKIKHISSGLLNKKEVGFYSDLKRYQVPKGLIEKKTGDLGVCLSYDDSVKPFEITLNLVPKTLILGLGCRKDTDYEKMKIWVLAKLKEFKISPKAIKSIASIDIKKSEACIIDLAKFLEIEFKTFTAEQLSTVETSKSSSDFVKSITGVDNVCERAALYESKGNLIIEKIAENGMTLAIAESRE